MSDEVQQALAEERQEIADVTITDDMVRDAAIALDANNATFGLDAADATVPVDSSTSEGDKEVIRLVSDLLFEFGSAELTSAASAQLPEILGEIPQGTAIQINGYTDSIGDDASNLTLSQQRAQAVADVAAAARPDLVCAVNGYGEADPVESNTNADGSDNSVGRSQNRRVEVVYEK